MEKIFFTFQNFDFGVKSLSRRDWILKVSANNRDWEKADDEWLRTTFSRPSQERRKEQE